MGNSRFQPGPDTHLPTGAFCRGYVETKGLILAPQVGLEPTTLRLTAECSTIELLSTGDKGSAIRGQTGYPLARDVCIDSDAPYRTDVRSAQARRRLARTGRSRLSVELDFLVLHSGVGVDGNLHVAALVPLLQDLDDVRPRGAEVRVGAVVVHHGAAHVLGVDEPHHDGQ